MAQQISSTRQEVVADLEDDKTPYAEHKTQEVNKTHLTRVTSAEVFYVTSAETIWAKLGTIKPSEK